MANTHKDPDESSNNRRSFLGRASVVLGSVLLRPPALNIEGANAAVPQPLQQSNSLELFAGESGNLHFSSYLVIGFFMARNTAKHLDQIRQLRTKHRFRRRLRYSSTDRFQRTFAPALLDYFFQQKELTFEARVLDYHNRNTRLQPLKDKEKALRQRQYVLVYKSLIGAQKPADGDVTINLMNHGVRQDVALHASLKESTDCKEVNLLLGATSELTQLSCLLAGCIFGDTSRGGKKASKNDYKGELVARVRQHVGRPRLLDGLLEKNPKFKVTVVDADILR